MKKGFTLIELLAVITVLAIILVIAIPNIQHLIDEKKKDTFLINAKSIIKQIKYEDKNFLTTQLSELNLEGIAKDGYDADLSTAYISDEEIHLNLVGAGQYEGMYLCNVNLTTNKSEVQNTPCEELEIYIVTFDPNGGSVAISSKEVIYNSTYGNLPIPKKEGYKFLGWNGKNMFNPQEFYEVGKDYNIEKNGDKIILKTYAYQENYSKLFIDFKNDTKYNLSYNWEVLNSLNNDFIVTGIYFGYKDISSTGYVSTYAFKGGTGEKGFISYTSDSSKKLERISSVGWQYNGIAILSNIQLEEGNTATEYEPYYVTKDVKVTQRKNHTLKAIWEEI